MSEEERTEGRVLSPVDNYGRVPWGLLSDPTVSDAECRAYAFLTTWDFRHTGKMFSKREDLAEGLGWSVPKLDRALRALEQRGAIRRIRRGPGKCNDIELLAETRQERSPRVVTSDDTESSPETTTSRENTRENQEKDLASADARPPKPRKRTPRDALWDAVTLAFGEATTETRRTLYGKTVRELVGAGATPEQVIQARAEMNKRGWSEPSPVAMLKHWDDLLSAAKPRERPRSKWDKQAEHDAQRRAG